jgi:hypothetical protein
MRKILPACLKPEGRWGSRFDSSDEADVGSVKLNPTSGVTRFSSKELLIFFPARRHASVAHQSAHEQSQGVTAAALSHTGRSSPESASSPQR